MQKRKALDSGCQLEQKKHMIEKEKHIEDIVNAMQADMGLDIEADMKTEACVITSNTNMHDMDKDLCTSLQLTDIPVTVKKEDILSACAHPEKKHVVATITDSCSTELKTTSSQQTEYANCNGETKSTNISLDEDCPNSTLQDVQSHFPTSVLDLPSSQEGDMLSKSNSEETFNDIPKPLVNKEGCGVELVHKDSSEYVLQVMKGSIAGNCEKGSAEEVQKPRAKEVKHSIHKQDPSKDASALLDEDLADESGVMPEASGTSAEGNLKTLSSPIRGLIHDLASLAEPNEKNLLNSSKKEEDGFSFQTTKKFLSDESSDNNSEKAHTGVESNVLLPIISKDGDVNSTVSHSVSGITNGVENEVNSLLISRRAENSFTSDPINSQDKKSEDVILEPARNLISPRKKLIVLDLNGLLADIILDKHNVYKATKKVGGKSVFKRPFCDNFLKFCFETFNIGVWSSRRKYNIDSVLDFIMGDRRHKLLFCWDQSHCTYTGFGTQENMHKPLLLKELKKLWLKEESDLPWEKGDYSASNTLLVDDSPYKALCNPPNTGIFPHPYHFDDENDASLGPGGDLRVYLEGLAVADDVQLYVQEHPFGQQAITKNNSSWDFYLRIIEKLEQPVLTTQ